MLQNLPWELCSVARLNSIGSVCFLIRGSLKSSPASQLRFSFFIYLGPGFCKCEGDKNGKCHLDDAVMVFDSASVDEGAATWSS